MSFTEADLYEDLPMTELPVETITILQPDENKKPLQNRSFAVVLPYFNEAEFLERTLESWLNQTRKPDRLILVDNGSTDGSEVVARRVLKDTGLIDLVVVGDKINLDELERVRKKTENLINRKISVLVLNKKEYKKLAGNFNEEPFLLLLEGERLNKTT